MKCVFCFSGYSKMYEEMAKVLVYSAVKNTSFDLYCIYDQANESFLQWLEGRGVKIIKWQVTFLADLEKRYSGSKSLEFCRGTYLCLEIPLIFHEIGFSDEYILYVDIDTMFLSMPMLDEFKPKYFMAPPDFDVDDRSRFSTGVMLMNLNNLLENISKFHDHLSSHNYNFEYAKMGPCDQGAWNTFYLDSNDWFEPYFDWKPWWGIKSESNIIHFSGPKPQEVNTLLNLNLREKGKLNSTDFLKLNLIDLDIEAYKYYLNIWNKFSKLALTK